MSVWTTSYGSWKDFAQLKLTIDSDLSVLNYEYCSLQMGVSEQTTTDKLLAQG